MLSTRRFGGSAVALTVLASALLVHAQQPASSPPMGWSAWDAWGMSVTESDFRANAEVLAGLRPYGWQYALLDAGWYTDRPTGHAAPAHYSLDSNGRLIPARSRFPSATPLAGFAPLAAWLHARGLRFGIHVMLGIPRQAVAANLPIAGSRFRAGQAADTRATCPWDREFYVVADNAAGQAYYDSIARLYARWGIDFIKLGCVSDQPFLPSEIRQVSEAIRGSGRRMLLSLSPGPPPQEYAHFVGRYAQMWRVGAEQWDFWTPPPGASNSVVGLRKAFDLFAQWSPFVKIGNWIDGDDLPDGWLAPHPPVGVPRHSRLTEDEQRSQFALWAFARAPLIEGANLTRLDQRTRALMTDRELLAIDQHAIESHPVTTALFDPQQVRVWEARIDSSGSTRRYFAFFNLQDRPATLHAGWSGLGLRSEPHSARDLWSYRDVAPAAALSIPLPPHGCAVYQVQ